MSAKLAWLLTEQPQLQPQEAKKDPAPMLVETEKKMTVVKAWEEYRKARAESKASQKLSDLVSWEIQKKASVEAKMRMLEQNMEKKFAQRAKKLKNKLPMIQNKVNDKKAMIEARKGKDLHKVEKVAEKFRANGLAPKKPFGF